MVFSSDSLRHTGLYGATNCYLEIFPPAISKDWLQFPSKPYLYLLRRVIPIYVPDYTIKGFFVLQYTTFIHHHMPLMD